MTPEQFNQLEQQLAYSAARADIETLCKPLSRAKEGGWWFSLAADNEMDDEDRKTVSDAIAYLDYRGLLKRSISNPDIVTVLGDTGE